MESPAMTGPGTEMGSAQTRFPVCDPTLNRPILQANPAMHERLKLLLWTSWFMETRNG